MSMVLIVSADGDWSAEQVAERLTVRGGRHVRLDPSAFPLHARVRAHVEASSWSGVILGPGGTVDLASVSGVYYRRPGDFVMPAGMSGPELRFARAQARVGLGGLLASLGARWINHPSALADAEYKPRQLSTAAAVGLTVPATLITNDPDEVRRFAGRVGDLVVKPFAEPIVEEAGGYTAVWTRRIRKGDLADLTGVESTAHLFQQWVAKTHEVRLTAVGRRLFPVAIRAGSEAALTDWRSDYDSLTYQVIDCPARVAAAVDRFLDVFGLRYGAFDFAVTDDGRWWFLECNGAGQLGWLAEECDLPIADAIADELMGKRT